MATLKDLNLLSIGNTIQLAGSVWMGEGKMYLALFPEDREASLDNVEILDMDADDWKTFLRQTDILETEILTKASDGTLAKAIVRKSQRHIDAALSWRVFKRDSYTCRYCSNDDTPLTVDHVVTWEDGGPTIEDNLLASCKRCNKTRGNTPYADWLKHPYYQKVSQNLRPETRQANSDLVGTLDKIPRLVHKRSR